MKRIIECVPNFSEGQNKEVIDAIAAAICSVEGVQVLHIDMGASAHRTVITFVGEAEAVVEAAFQGVRTAQERIDMSGHHGEHPRIGATDVLPLIPISGITLEECAEMARGLAERIAKELGIPTYCYEAAAYIPERKNLAVCRRGEYEGLRERLTNDAPDYGARPWDSVIAKSGASVVGARNFLIAVNFNLDSTSTRLANAIAFDVREKGRPLRTGPLPTDPFVLDERGNKVWQPGTLKGVKALGWYIEEYGVAQVSMNITDISQTSLHRAFEEVSRCAKERGARVTGTEIIGLVPSFCLTAAGKYFLEKEGKPADVSDEELMSVAVKAMGLDDLAPFDMEKKVIRV